MAEKVVGNTGAGNGSSQENEDLVRLFECPVCLEYASPPIYQCKSGHLLCSSCFPKLKTCPSCRGPLDSTRNFAMEKVARSIMTPCKNSINGCSVLFPADGKLSHETTCEFRPCPCPNALNSCVWSGAPDKLLEHVSKCFSAPTINNSRIRYTISVCSSSSAERQKNLWARIQNCFQENFLFILYKSNMNGDVLYNAVVMYFGRQKHAERFNYRLRLSQGSNSLVWSTTPRSVHESAESIIRECDCLSFNAKTANKFVKNGHLSVEVEIYREHSELRYIPLRHSPGSLELDGLSLTFR